MGCPSFPPLRAANIRPPEIHEIPSTKAGVDGGEEEGLESREAAVGVEAAPDARRGLTTGTNRCNVRGGWRGTTRAL